MIILKIILGFAIFLLASIWLAVLIGVGVRIGLKNYFEESSRKGGR